MASAAERFPFHGMVRMIDSVEPADLTEQLDRLVEEMARHRWPEFCRLRPGLSEDEIRTRMAAHDLAPTGEVLTWYRYHNGTDPECFAFHGWLLSLQESLDDCYPLIKMNADFPVHGGRGWLPVTRYHGEVTVADCREPTSPTSLTTIYSWDGCLLPPYMWAPSLAMVVRWWTDRIADGRRTWDPEIGRWRQQDERGPLINRLVGAPISDDPPLPGDTFEMPPERRRGTFDEWMADAVGEQVARLDEAMARHGWPEFCRLRPGLSEDEIRTRMAAHDLTPTSEVLAWYRCHNGTHPHATAFNGHLLPLTDSLHLYPHVATTGTDTWPHHHARGWLPLATNPTTTTVADCRDPASPSSHVTIHHRHTGLAEPHYWAPALTLLLRWWADRIDDGRWTWNHTTHTCHKHPEPPPPINYHLL